MKAKLWEIKTKHSNPRYWGERDEITVNARTIPEVKLVDILLPMKVAPFLLIDIPP